MTEVPLTDRAPGDILFRLPGRDVTAGAFIADALRLAAGLPEARYVLNLCTGRYAFAAGFAAALLRGQMSLMSSDRSPERLAALAAAYPQTVTLTDADLPAPGNDTAAAPQVPADRLAAIVFTSGSTGAPVAHEKRWGALVARTRAAAQAFGFSPGAPASILGMVPPQHMYGFETTVLLPLHAPVSSWCGPAFFPADVSAASVPGAVLVTTPLQLRTLLDHGTALPPLRAIVSATAPLDPAMAAAAEARWGAPVHEIFGATEVGSIASRRTVAGADWTPYPSVQLVQTADGMVVTADGAPAVALDDLVELEGDRFRLLGRRADLVKLGGRRASLAGLNRALAAVEGVMDGVFVPPEEGDHRAGARMTAVVVAPQISARSIIDALRGRIDPIFLPRRVVHVDRLPRNDLGKLAAGAARQLAAP